jgi:hypothetical protein
MQFARWPCESPAASFCPAPSQWEPIFPLYHFIICNFRPAHYSTCRLLSRWYLAQLIWPWRWRRYFPPKLLCLFQRTTRRYPEDTTFRMNCVSENQLCYVIGISCGLSPRRLGFSSRASRMRSVVDNVFYHPSLFTTCTSRFSKLVEGCRWEAWSRALISFLL